MNWNDYEAVWKRQPRPLGAKADVAELKHTFARKSRKLAAAVQVRDYAEAGAGVVVAIAYVFYWRQVGAAGWPMAFALALVLGLTGFFVRERFRASRFRLGLDAPLLAKVDADIALLQRQCHLVRRVWVWYLAPGIGAMAIHAGVIYRQSAAWSPIRETPFIVGLIVFLAFVVWFAWFINYRALRQQLQPRLVELEKLREELVRE